MTEIDPQYQQQLSELVTARAADRAALLEALFAAYLELARGGTTATGLPYPHPDDPLAEGADAIRALAEAVDAKLAAAAAAVTPIARGGTGATTPTDALANLGGVPLTAVRPVTVGGTGANTAAQAAVNLNVVPWTQVAPGDLAEAGKVPRYNANRQLTAIDPTADAHVATKGYVDRAGGGGLADGPTTAAYNRNATGPGSWFTVWMNAANQFMRNTSSRRYKEVIETPEDLDGAVQALLDRRVGWRRYHRVGQPDGTRELGLIAEELVDIPHLVTWDVERDPDTGEPVDGAPHRPEAVRYETVLPVYLLEMIQRVYAQLQDVRAELDELKGRGT